MLKKYIEEILKIYNLVDDICIVDKDGIIQYVETFRQGAYSYNTRELIGKHIFEIYTSSNETTSNLYEVLKTGKPIFNRQAEWKTFMGDIRSGTVDTLPIMQGREIIGAIEIARFLGEEFEKREISVNSDYKSRINKTKKHYSLDDIVTKNDEMIEIKKKIRRLAQRNINNRSSIMIYGKTGTGKEMIAQAIHSLCCDECPFISQNCAAIPDTLLESILFGTEKGSFTGAENRKGLFELAHGGTLFLDEINSMDIGIQAKILKAVEEKKIMKIGGQSPVSIDVRIISGLNENPRNAVKENRLREDLFYRLSTVQIDLPSLNERKEDIELLVEHFINEFNDTMNMDIIGISDEVKKIFHDYKWPGNIRELRNIIEGAFNITNGKYIRKSDLPGYILAGSEQDESMIRLGERTLEEMMNEYEKMIIIEALNTTSNKIEAADLLGLTKQSFNYRLDKYDLKNKK